MTELWYWPILLREIVKEGSSMSAADDEQAGQTAPDESPATPEPAEGDAPAEDGIGQSDEPASEPDPEG